MHVAVTARRVIARHPWIYWAVCLAIAIAAAVLATGYVTALDDARNDWGTTRTVLVASTDQLPGEALRTSTVDMPITMIPPDAVDTVDLAGRTTILRQHIMAGEVVVSADLARPAGPAALADDGTLVVGMTDPLARDVRIGLDVQVAAEGIVLAERATVVDLADDVIFVAVGSSAAAMVAAAAHDGTASIIFTP